MEEFNCEPVVSQRQKERFVRFLEERTPVLVEFAKIIGASQPSIVLQDASELVELLHEWMADLEVEDDNAKFWLIARLGYFIGECFLQKYGGYWLLNDDPNSKFLVRHVIGGFSQIRNGNAVLDPLEVALACVQQPLLRDFKGLLSIAEKELLAS